MVQFFQWPDNQSETLVTITNSYILKSVTLVIETVFELTYRDSGNMIHFSVFMMKIFPPCPKVTIPKYNAFSFS